MLPLTFRRTLEQLGVVGACSVEPEGRQAAWMRLFWGRGTWQEVCPGLRLGPDPHWFLCLSCEEHQPSLSLQRKPR